MTSVAPTTKLEYAGFLNALKSTNLTLRQPPPLGLASGGSRVLWQDQEMRSMPSAMNPTTRIVQPNPICGISFLIMIGKITPPY